MFRLLQSILFCSNDGHIVFKYLQGNVTWHTLSFQVFITQNFGSDYIWILNSILLQYLEYIITNSPLKNYLSIQYKWTRWLLPTTSKYLKWAQVVTDNNLIYRAKTYKLNNLCILLPGLFFFLFLWKFYS